MHVVDLEAKLAADRSGVLRDDLCAAIADDRGAIRRKIDGGLPPEAFRVAQAFCEACNAAERVVNEFWRQSQTGLRAELRPPR